MTPVDFCSVRETADMTFENFLKLIAGVILKVNS